MCKGATEHTPAAYRPVRTGLMQRLFAKVQSKGNARYERMIEERKRELFKGVSGTVLEIGPGTGVNLRYYPKGVRWIGIEPNVFMHDYLKDEARRLGIEVDVRTGTAEQIEAEDESVDVVVSTLVLCSVNDVGHTLREILRVLKPGGRFIFIEHVAAGPGTLHRRLQRMLRPAWKVICDGCRPDQETWKALEGSGFDRIHYERFKAQLPIVSPHLAGIATKAEANAISDDAIHEDR